MYEVHRFRLGLTSKEPKTVLCVRDLVDGMGFEPTTPTLRTWCSPS